MADVAATNRSPQWKKNNHHDVDDNDSEQDVKDAPGPARKEEEEVVSLLPEDGVEVADHGQRQADQSCLETQTQEAMERFLREQEERMMLEGAEPLADRAHQEPQPDVAPAILPPLTHGTAPQPRRLSYRQASFGAAVAMLWYAFRTRQQFFLVAVYLSSSKLAYVIFGNALVALLTAIFDALCNVFLGGLRLQEAEGLQDFFRWNVTETCLALTMFRDQLSIQSAIEFLILILGKCLHHIAILREQHLRLTEDAFYESSHGWPLLKTASVKLALFLWLLQVCDLWVAQNTVQDLLQNGPSVNILFAFEAAILLVSAWSHLLLWYFHTLDSWLHFGHERQWPYFRRIIHPWREHKATFIFAVELQAQAIQFGFYLTFFAIVLTYYGMPINLFRELYVSFAALKGRLAAFFKYRRLMAGLNTFTSPTEEHLEEAGRTCIICRDEMTIHDCKQLPGCQHIFHKSCLREWLVQQQTCPTCRSDIATMQARETAATVAAGAATLRQRQTGDDSGGNDASMSVAHSEDNDAAAGMAAPDSSNDIPVDDSDVSHQDRSTTNAWDVLRSSMAATTKILHVDLALYKVRTKGTVVTRSSHGTIVRTIAGGVIILCQGEILQTSDGCRFIRIPDGWVSEDTVEFLGRLPTTQPTRPAI